MEASRGRLFPTIPQKLWQIDAGKMIQHFMLEPGDLCFYIWEYTRRRGFSAGPANSLISNLKKKPSTIARNPAEEPHKAKAIAYAAGALRELIRGDWIESQWTLVPMPCSKIAGHVDHDDRMRRVVELAFGGYRLDIRSLIEQTHSTTADHDASERLRFRELAQVIRINESVTSGVRPRFIVFDDVLNSGKHFKVAQRVLRIRFPGCIVLGVFLARCVPDPTLASPAVEVTSAVSGAGAS